MHWVVVIERWVCVLTETDVAQSWKSNHWSLGRQGHQKTLCGDGPLWVNYWPTPDLLWLLIEMGLCECWVPSCISSEITTAAVRGCSWCIIHCISTSSGGFCLWMTAPWQTALVPFSFRRWPFNYANCSSGEYWSLSETLCLIIENWPEDFHKHRHWYFSVTFQLQSLIYCLKVYFHTTLIIFHTQLLNKIKSRVSLWNLKYLQGYVEVLLG